MTLVLHDVAVESGEMTPLPTVWSQLATYPTVRQPSRRPRTRNGTRGLHLEVREDEPGSSASSVAGARRGRAPGEKCQRSIARSTPGRTRQRPDAGRVEHPVRMARLHPLEVEAVAVVEADREREVADPPVEPAVGAAHDTLGHGTASGASSSAWNGARRRAGAPPTPRRPRAGTRTTTRRRRRGARRRRSTIPQSKKTRIESGSARTTQTRFAVTRPCDPGAPARSRSASDAPSSP